VTTSADGLGVIPREEWERRYAARIMERAGWPEHAAISASRAGSEAYAESERDCGNVVVGWGGPSGSNTTPEDEADEEMNYWTDDGEG
jgi:hypothetical protein